MMKIKIAYVLLAHKNPKQINLFVQQLLKYGDCEIYIHIDKKSENIISQIKENKKVHVYSIFDVRWGSFEIIEATLYLMRIMLNSGNIYSHVYFGSGQDLLVKKGLYEYLEEYPDNIFLKIEKEIKKNDLLTGCYKVKWPKELMVRDDWRIKRFIRIFIECMNRMGITFFPNKRKIDSNIKIYMGRTWFIAPVKVISYIVCFLENNKSFMDYWKDSLASDLMFFQTIIMNSPFKYKVTDELMYVNFGKTFGTKNHPLTITEKDISKIQEGNYYCARKFEIKESKVIKYFVDTTIKKSEL